jgi:ParB family chromosome partitioning protein
MYKEVNLKNITPNPHNPRTCFEGRAFDELVASIKKQGVIEPVIVRALNGSGSFELIAGERRFRASKEAGKESIPALVKDLTDDQAFDVMTIENLQRENLTEYEEAKAFKLYVDRKGADKAVAELAERTGINHRYIQRRVAVLSLPDYILTIWQENNLLYGSRKMKSQNFMKIILTRSRVIIGTPALSQ